jgi:hypothetical protein
LVLSTAALLHNAAPNGSQNNQNGGHSGGGHIIGQNGGTKPPIQYTKYSGQKSSTENSPKKHSPIEKCIQGL